MTRLQTLSWTDIWKRTFNFLLFCCLTFILLYGYFVSASIVNVLVRKEIEQDITALHSHIGELEAAYLVQKNQITLSYAHAQGFSNISEKQFAIRRDGIASGLTVNSE